jgi:hypothetical protein
MAPCPPLACGTVGMDSSKLLPSLPTNVAAKSRCHDLSELLEVVERVVGIECRAPKAGALPVLESCFS